VQQRKRSPKLRNGRPLVLERSPWLILWDLVRYETSVGAGLDEGLDRPSLGRLLVGGQPNANGINALPFSSTFVA
jgi:hypothetical protein